MDDTIFRILIAILLITAFSVSGYYRSKAQRTGGDKIDRSREGAPVMILLRIFGFGMWLSILVWVINPAWLAFAALPFPEWLRWLGFGLCLIALPLLVWMFRSLGNSVTDTVQTRENAMLVVRGPYRLVRHPLYSFGVLFAIGLMLMTANGLIIVLGTGALTMLLLRTPQEEELLVAKFGDEYRNYMAHTPRFVPKMF